MDLITDDATVKAVGKKAKELTSDGKYQDARRILRNFASEIDLTTVNLPMASYPDAIRHSARLIHEGKTKEARAELQTALNSLVIAEEATPLPVVKAAALVDEVQRKMSQNKVKKDEATQMLDRADFQLQLAQDMGYATTKNEYSDVRSSIQQVKKELASNQKDSGLISKLKNDLASIRDKMKRHPASQ
jgi:hypothetical protein